MSMLRGVVEFLRILNRPCREHALLIADDLESRTGRPARAALRIHRLICTPCRRLHAQLRLLRRAAERISPAAAERALGGARMPADVRERLGRTLGASRD
jgi:hypothetical protein